MDVPWSIPRRDNVVAGPTGTTRWGSASIPRPRDLPARDELGHEARDRWISGFDDLVKASQLQAGHGELVDFGPR